MAACWRSPSPFPFPQFPSHNKLHSIPKPLVSVSESVFFRFPTGFSLAKSSFPIPTSIPITPNPRFPSLTTISCSSTSDSATPSDESPSLFIKGLPKSTTEARLMKAFSQFGRVSQVKILTDRETGQSLGLAYVWFVKQEFAELAARQLNRQFFDGRFIFVTIIKRSFRKRRKGRQYKF